MAPIAASITPASAPFQPAWTAPMTPACGSASRIGWQSAVSTAMAMPGWSVTMASARILPISGNCAASLTTATSAEWVWCTVSSAAGATPIASATRARLIATISP